jgi:hypothetical protein
MDIRMVRLDADASGCLVVLVSYPNRTVVWADRRGFGVPSDLDSLKELMNEAEHVDFVDAEWERAHPDSLVYARGR